MSLWFELNCVLHSESQVVIDTKQSVKAKIAHLKIFGSFIVIQQLRTKKEEERVMVIEYFSYIEIESVCMYAYMYVCMYVCMFPI